METASTKKSAALDNFQDFDMAVNEAKHTGLDHLEVTPKLFKNLTKGTVTPYLTWGSPGIKVFQEGTMKSLLQDELMGAEQHREMVIKAGKTK